MKPSPLNPYIGVCILLFLLGLGVVVVLWVVNNC